MTEGPLPYDFAARKAKAAGESERLGRTVRRCRLILCVVWPLSLAVNIYVFAQNIASGGIFHGLLAGVNATMISVSVCGILWTWFLWPLLLSMMK